MSDFTFDITDNEFSDMLNIGIEETRKNKAYAVARLYVTTIETRYMPEVDSEKFKTIEDATLEFNRCNHAVITHRGKIIALKCVGNANFYGVSPRGALVDTRSDKESKP